MGSTLAVDSIARFATHGMWDLYFIIRALSLLDALLNYCTCNSCTYRETDKGGVRNRVEHITSHPTAGRGLGARLG